MITLESKKKGFTLVELMIVLAVIALLLLVLLPRVGPIKNKSREAGIRQNMAMLEGMVQNVIDQYTVDPAGVTAVEAKLAYDISSVAVVNQRMKNPVTGGTAVSNDPSALNNTIVVAYDAGDDAADGAGINGVWGDYGDPLGGSAGVIGYAAYVDTSYTPNKLSVLLMPFGVDSKRMTANDEKEISQ